MFWGFLSSRSWQRTTHTVRHPKHMTYKEKMGELGLFNLMRRRLRCNIVTCHNYLKGSYKGDGTEVVLVVQDCNKGQCQQTAAWEVHSGQ